jgi:hypothetical protein
MGHVGAPQGGKLVSFPPLEFGANATPPREHVSSGLRARAVMNHFATTLVLQVSQGIA